MALSENQPSQPVVLSENTSQSGPSPSLTLTDTTGGEEDLLIKVDGGKANLRDAAGSDGELVELDLANKSMNLGDHTGLTQLSKLNITDDGVGTGGATFHNFDASVPLPNIAFRSARGTKVSPTASQLNDFLGSVFFKGHDGVSFPSGSSAEIRAIAAETFTVGNNGADIAFHVTANGSTTRLEKMRLTNDGKLGINQDTPAHLLDLQGSLGVKRVASGAGNVNTADEVIIGVDNTAAPRTVTLQTADTVVGRILFVKDESGGAGTNNITIGTEASETIDGAATLVISSNFGVARLYSDGTNWFTL